MVTWHGWVPMVEILWFRKSPHMYHKVFHMTILTMFALFYDIVMQFAFLQVLNNLTRLITMRSKPDYVEFLLL